MPLILPHTAAPVRGEELDQLLAAGYFRIGEVMHRFDFFPFVYKLQAVHWIRYNLQKFQASREAKRIIRKNKKFWYGVRPGYINGETEYLYQRYYLKSDLEISESTYGHLYNDKINRGFFETGCIEIRDDKKLIGAGLLDAGNKSLAAIMNFYDPEYKKFSLGKYLLLLQIRFGIKKGYDYLYPGYLVRDQPKFDYKLFPDIHCTEIFMPETRQWVPFSWPLPVHNPDYHGKMIYEMGDWEELWKYG